MQQRTSSLYVSELSRRGLARRRARIHRRALVLRGVLALGCLGALAALVAERLAG
jgi:hypothetical protein